MIYFIPCLREFLRSGNKEVNFVLALLRFARFVFDCLVGLEGSVKYSSFLKLKGP